jgi:hypothetical protein
MCDSTADSAVISEAHCTWPSDDSDAFSVCGSSADSAAWVKVSDKTIELRSEEQDASPELARPTFARMLQQEQGSGKADTVPAHTPLHCSATNAASVMPPASGVKARMALAPQRRLRQPEAAPVDEDASDDYEVGIPQSHGWRKSHKASWSYKLSQKVAYQKNRRLQQSRGGW